MIKAIKGDTVKVRYTGRLTDGTVFDESADDRPLHFIIGKQEVIEGFDAAVIGMYQGETKTVTIPPNQAYGETKPELIEQVDRNLLPKDLQLVAGRQLEVTQEDDSSFLVMVTELTDALVTLDANHPLAGKELEFEIELLEVKKTEQPGPVG